jgi:NAD(P)-dependent dehydrogenase (short-subunit alcohol dehydrogenase family)
MIPMQTVVITGSTRGLGFTLAEAFLQRDCAVVICGRTESAVHAALAALTARYNADRIHARPCDVGDFAQVQCLWDEAIARFGRVDIWINNAGLGGKMKPFWEMEPQDLDTIVSTNLIGSMYGSRVALAGMVAQGSGALWNMEGFGSDGATRPGLTPYATTKSAIRYLTDALVAETKGKPVFVGAISPGMMVTDLLLANVAPGQEKSARRVFNILADKVETVAPWIADNVLATTKTGQRIIWLTKSKIYKRFAAAPFRRRNVLD